MSGECNLQLLHEFKENNYDGKVIITKTFIATIAGWFYSKIGSPGDLLK